MLEDITKNSEELLLDHEDVPVFMKKISLLSAEEFEAFIAFAFKLSGNHYLNSSVINEGQEVHPLINKVQQLISQGQIKTKFQNVLTTLSNKNVDIKNFIDGNLNGICIDSLGSNLICSL